MQTATYRERRGQLETYFDRTAVEAWSRLTSDAPVSWIRATVRAGRDRMRQTLLSWLPSDLRGRRVLDAGCGTGALAIEAARRGASVVAIDVAPTLIRIAHDRTPRDLGSGSVEFRAGDMLDASAGRFDHIVAMDSLIHYNAADCLDVLSVLAARTQHSVLFTVAPRTPLLATMHAIGRLFPRSERAPSIQPIGIAALQRNLDAEPRLLGWNTGRTERIAGGFYISQAMELRAQ
jgi:magnesium-protoporphyrin O-methyltransferase